ncbi:MAG: GGDEF domain-containing protein [Burkholderiales bacterium]|nr:GGDEF domain-containing protein [Burkholderiales bacterium]
MIRSLPEWIRPILVPGGILVAAALLAAADPSLPPSLAGLRTLAPYTVLGLAGAVTLWFNRGRAFVVALSLLAAYGGQRYAAELGYTSFAAHVYYVAAVVLVPLNVFAALVLPERGAVHGGSLRWIVLIVAELALVGWLASWGQAHYGIENDAWIATFEHWALRSPPVPLVGRVAFAAAFAAAVWRAYPRFLALDVGKAGALVAFYIACSWIDRYGAFGSFMTAAGLILLVAVMQESYRLAFRDELTGLPSRRALEERMRALGARYTVAMGDVDHFKKFNDTHGHDVGDQVLRLVAARLAEVGGGGRAFRYGGEEFTVLFPDTALKDALPHLDAVRKAVEEYRMAIRGEDRPKSQKKGSKLRGDGQPDETLSVTISIGASEPKPGMKPSEVIKAADEALYRAKQAGRNRVGT